MITNFDQMFEQLRSKPKKRLVAAWGVDDHTISAVYMAVEAGIVEGMLVGDEDEQLTEPELEITFSECEDSDFGTKMLCATPDTEQYPDHTTLLHIVTDPVTGFELGEGSLEIVMKDTDLKFGNWKKTKACLK